MRQFTSRHAAILAGVLVLVAVFGFVGCADSPLDSGSQTGSHLLTRAPRATGGASLSPVNLYTEQVISSKQGGTLSLLDVTLTIPAGAVPNDTTFSIFIPDDQVFYNEFGTDGLVFKKPVSVTMSYRNANLSGVNEATIRLAWYNPSTGAYIDVPCTVDTVNKTVTAELQHFSAYGLISD